MVKVLFLLFICGCSESPGQSTDASFISKICIDKVMYLVTYGMYGRTGITVQYDQNGNVVSCPVITP